MNRTRTLVQRLRLPAVWLALGLVCGLSCSSMTLPCDKVTCPTGQICDSLTGVCRVGGLCGNVTCPPSSTCDPTNGLCKAGPGKCTGVTCPAFQSCDNATGKCGLMDPPNLGGLIDRMGRAAVNAALTDPFGVAPNKTREQVQDIYNTDLTSANWVTVWGAKPYLMTSLAVYDSLNGICGDQQAADAASPRYSYLATILANDYLAVNTNSGVCSTYLAVETGITADCGGRTPSYDVIDATYTALVGAGTPVPDGVAAAQMYPAEFPYLNAPQ